MAQTEERVGMKYWRRALMGMLIGITAFASLGLGGCIIPNKEGSFALSSAKIAPPAIAAEGVLKVWVDPSHAPFAGYSDNVVIGIDVDIAAALAEQMGLKLEIVRPDDFPGKDINALLRDGDVDVAMGIQGDTASLFTEVQVGPYLIDGPAIFAVGLTDESQNFDPAQIAGMKVVAQEDSLAAWQIRKDYGDENLLTYPSLEKTFDELAAGSVSYAAADAIVGSFQAVQSAQYENIRCEGMLPDSTGVYMGVAAGREELATKLTEALRDLRDGGNLQIVVAKWLGPVSAQTVLSGQAIVSLASSGEGTTDTEAEVPPDPEAAAAEEE
jgi:polar amino acid transport system substrate-binding protein